MATPPRIVIHNVHENEVLPHPLVVLDGVIEGFSSLALNPSEWFIHAQIDPVRGAFWPVTSTGRFKATVILPNPATYTVTLRFHSLTSHEIHLEYRPVVSQYAVRFYYMKCIDARPTDGFDAPPGTNNSDDEAMAKIRFNALLLQTAMAEMLVHAGLPRKTFTLEFASDGLPLVHLLRTSFTTAEARSIHEQVLIRRIEDDIVAQGYNTHEAYEFKHEVILGCSTYNPATRGPIGHSALGGGKVGIFGSCGLHTWPKHLGELTPCLLDNRRIDTNYMWDDSAYRGTFWANFSTGIGAFIHELGHTFGLGHSTSGIMSRGFDDMNRLFCAYQADHNRHEPAFFQTYIDGRLLLNHDVVKEVTGPKGAHWNSGSALQLIQYPWVSAVKKQSPCGPLICWTSEKLGPLGWGTSSSDGVQTAFNLSPPIEPLAAIRITVNAYVDQFVTYTRNEFAALPPKKLRCKGTTHWVILADNEVITHVEIRAGAWIDGVRFVTNRRATRWFGGFGGDLHVLRPTDGHIISGFFGSHGRYLDRLGVHCAPVPVPSIASSSVVFASDGEVEVSVRATGQKVVTKTQRYADYMVFHDRLGAVVITDSEDHVEKSRVVESIRMVSREAHEGATKLTDRAVYESGEHVFALAKGEVIQLVCVRSGKWIEAIQFHTNQRISPWFGGKGGADSIVHEIAAPSDEHGLWGIRYRRDHVHIDQFSGLFRKLVVEETAPALVSSLQRVGPVGEGRGDGQQRAFVSVPSTGNMEVIAVDAGQYIADIKTGSVVDVETLGLSAQQVFTLEPGEIVTKVDVRAAWWVDGVQFHTDRRSSPQYGGTGGSLYELQPPPGYRVQGVFGSKGSEYIGTIGLLCTPIDPMAADSTVSPSAIASTATSYAMLGSPPVESLSTEEGAARGVIVAVQDGVVRFVQSFTTLQKRQALATELAAFAASGATLYSFTLRAGEWFTQIDASVNSSADEIHGVCFHTTTRCSSWFGAYDDDRVHFISAPPGHVIQSIVGDASMVSLQNLRGQFVSQACLPLKVITVDSLGNVVEDPGSYDIRLVSQSSHGITSVILQQKREHEDLDHHAWRWQSTMPCPLRLCVPQRMLEHHVDTRAGDASLKQALFTRYAIGAMDTGGGFTASSSSDALAP